MFSSHLTFRRLLGVTLTAVLAGALPCAAQVTPAAGSTPPDDTPAIKVGVTIFADYTFQQQPKVQEPVDGNIISPNSFNIGRSYINVTGNISHSIAFRITPDITRETGGSSLNGSYTFRLKYAYAQWNLDDHMSKGSFARFGMQPTPWVGFVDEVYRYRFQGQGFEERDGFLFSSDVGASFHYNLPRNYGDVHAGVYNGDGYNKAESNDQKGWMVRGTVRPLARGGLALRGLRVSGFFDRDMYVKSADRQRAIVAVTFEHTYLNAAFHYLTAKDQTSAALTATEARGWSAWVTPKTTKGWEGLLRFDSVEPTTQLSSQKKNRTIAGVAYWFPHQGNVSTALLFDVDNTKFNNFAPAQATQRKIAVHALVNF